MPHVEISHFPAELAEPAKIRLEQDIVAAVIRAFGVREGAVSIGLAPVDPDQWSERVYRPLITDRPDGAGVLRSPDY
ncbi:tautomerase family protein [Nocardia macrotermitis]|uniref:Tautomerase PptA n=1 Tax=Nocardia macrotermitis TaxID=2585198 RepID=A0A7K0D955_9NOCA|nr:hypothetical protein [Nocardia macrotermitis]MQY22238.1 Tautomerase PptA [Nocardia macrotermitis]